MKERKIPSEILLLVNTEYEKTIEALQIKGTSLLDSVTIIHEFMDYYNRLVHEPDACCTRKCYRCCYLDIEIFLVEAAYISNKTGIFINENVQDRLVEPPMPCVFLDQEKKECTIYPYRPIVCRNHLCFDDPQYCWPPNQLHIITSPENGWGQPMIYQLAIDLWKMSDPMLAFDIRAWFSKGGN